MEAQILSLRRLGLEECEASLDHIMRPCLQHVMGHEKASVL